MLEYYFKRPRIQARIRANVLCKQIRKLICYMHDCGYQPGTIQRYILNAEHFGMWLKANGIMVSSVNKDTIKSFLNEHLPSSTLDGLSPLQAFPQARHSGRFYRPEWEAQLLDLQRVYSYLAEARWFRLISEPGTFSLGRQIYYLDHRLAQKQIEITSSI